jgi:hypothetical protein
VRTRITAITLSTLACACSGDAAPSGPRDSGRCASIALAPWAEFADVREVYALLVADLDGDGAPDVVAPESTRERVSVFLNRTRDGGSFTRLQLPAGQNPTSVAVADLDRDGAPELYIGGSDDGGVAVLTHVTDAQPPSPQMLENLGAAPIGGLAFGDEAAAPYFAAGDRYSNTLQGTRAGPGGTLTPLFAFDAGGPLGHAVAADLDGDGHADVAFTVFFTGIAVVTTRNGPAITTVTQATSANLDDLVAADFDSDGDIDLIQAAGTSIGVYLNDGRASFRATEVYDAGLQFQGVAAADFDFDGRIDVVGVQGDTGHELDILLNRGGVLELAVTYGADAGIVRPPHVVTADFDGDGLPDVAFSDYDATSFRVFRNVSTGCPAAGTSGVHWRASGCALAGGDWPLAVLAVALLRALGLAKARTSGPNRTH